MKIVLDTNIIFSALLNTNGNIGKLIFNSSNIFSFYSCNYMRYEISNHWKKLKYISKLNDNELEKAKFLIYEKITFINEEIIEQKFWEKAIQLTQKIDEDDVDFVALTLFLKAKLWTGDKVLLNGLKKLNFIQILSTEDILNLYQNKLKF